MSDKKTTKKKVAKKAAKKVSKKKVTAQKTAKKKKVSKKVNAKIEDAEKPEEVEAPTEDSEEEIVIPKLDGKNLKKEIAELEKADSGKKEAPKRNTRGGSRKTKAKRVITARKAGPGLRFAPGVKISGSSKKEEPKKKKEVKQKKYRRLTPEELEETRIKLIDMRENILENMRKELADYRLRASSSSADPVDQAADAYDDNVSFEIAANSDQELEQIDSALEKIEKGTYGLCEMCSVTISPSRLKILPFATRCVSCRSNYEQTKTKKDANNSWTFPDGEDSDD